MKYSKILAVSALWVAAVSSPGNFAKAGNYEVGPGEYTQHYSGGGTRNFTVPKGETHSIDIKEGDDLSVRDPDTGEVRYFEAKEPKEPAGNNE